MQKGVINLMSAALEAIPESMLKMFDQQPAFPVKSATNILSNLKPGLNMLGITTDDQGLDEWLKLHEHSPKTHRSYILEARRLYLWARYECGKPVSSLTHHDMSVYWQHLLNPNKR